MRKRKDFSQLGDVQAPCWLSPDEVWELLRVLEPKRGKLANSLKSRLDELWVRFTDSLERLRELQKVATADGFWLEDKGQRAKVVTRDMKSCVRQRQRQQDIMSACKSEVLQLARERLPQKKLRGGLET